jgi:hypothetical protein
MSDAPMIPDRQPLRQVACPECGELFAPRGMASHRRMRHGVAPAAVNELGATLARIAEVLERLETRLDARSAPEPAAPKVQGEPGEPPPALPSRPATRGVELRVLEHGLREVMEEIAKVKSETERQIVAWGGHAETDEQRALEETSYRRLGNLRRRQASLLFRLQEARGEDAVDNLLCM